ncbi:MAG TPA: hypothetical protein VL087_10720 [Nitrospirota bacterium]|nr:hypothetical protein [Nitrospirota bacterium]
MSSSAAGVDMRIADKSLATSIGIWETITKVTEIWSKTFAFGLCQDRGATDCISPFPTNKQCSCAAKQRLKAIVLSRY